MIKLLYVADNGFSERDGHFFYSKPNYVNAMQYAEYFDNIYYLARKSEVKATDYEIDDSSKVMLCEKHDIIGLRRAASILLDEVDAVVLRNGINGCFIADIARKKDKIIISYNGADPYEFQVTKSGIKGKLIAPIWRRLEKKRMASADFGHYCAKFLYDLYPCKGEALICSNVSIKCEQEVLNRRLKKIEGDSNTTTKIGLIGQLNDDRKGISDAIRVIAQLKENDVTANLEIVGEGKKEKWVSQAKDLDVSENITFLGYVSDRGQLFTWLDSIDLYIQPSICEGLPRSMIEAMSRGCPVIATNIDAIPELIAEEWLVKPREHVSLSNKMNEMIGSKTKQATAAVENFNTSKGYEEEIRKKKMDKFYSKVVAECKGRSK